MLRPGGRETGTHDFDMSRSRESGPRPQHGAGYRLLVPRAGNGPSNNLIRSLKAGDPSLFIVGIHDDRFTLKRSLADRNYLIREATLPDYARALRKLIRTERIDLVIPNNEVDVRTVADLREELPCCTFLPRARVIDLCHDKYRLGQHLHRRGLPVPATCEVTALDKIDEIFRCLAPRRMLWCRVRKGSGSFGAIPVKTPQHARNWIMYWQEMRGVCPQDFTLSEYLPGRDYCVQTLWHKGNLVLARMHQRLAYFAAGSSASGVSSTAAFAKMVMEPRVAKMCARAINALDSRASGAFFVDVKENEHGTPCITEINAGRFANVSTIHDVVAQHNMATTYVRLALGIKVAIADHYERPRECYVLRGLDTAPANFWECDLLQGLCRLPARKVRRPRVLNSDDAIAVWQVSRA